MTGIKALRRIQMGGETAAGTPVIATAIHRGTGTLEDTRELKHPKEDIGYISPVDRAYIPMIGAQLKMGEVEATFEQLPYPLAAGIKSLVSGVKDGSGSGYIYAYPLSTTAANALKTRTLECGDDQQMERAEYAFVEEITITGKPEEALKVSSTWRARQAAVNAVTAGTIAFVAATKKITDSANGLAGFATGSRIVVSGTTSNDGTYTVATGGVAAEIVVTEALVNESAGTSFTIEQTFTVVALPTVEEILFQKGKLYIDAVGGTLGGSLKSSTFIGMTLKIMTGYRADFTGDGNLHFTKVSPGESEVTLDITFEHDGISTAEKAYWRTKTSRKIRMLFEGELLATAGTLYSRKCAFFDFAGKWDTFSALDENKGNDIVKGTFRAKFNSTASLYAVLTVVNELSALP